MKLKFTKIIALYVFSCFLSANILALEITITTPTTQLEMSVDSQKFDNLDYLHLPTILLKLDIQVSFYDTKIKMIKDNIQVEIDLLSTTFAVTESNATKLLQLSHPLKVHNDTVWIEFNDLRNLMQEVFKYQITSKELNLNQDVNTGEFADISIPSTSSSGGNYSETIKKQGVLETNETNKKWNGICQKKILIVPGHFNIGNGIKYSEKLTEKDINAQLSQKIADILGSMNFEIKVFSQTNYTDMGKLSEYLTKESPDLILSIHTGHPSQGKISANIFCSKFNDMEIDQTLMEFVDKLLQNFRKENESLLARVYLCPLILSSVSGIPELSIEFIPEKLPDKTDQLESFIKYKQLVHMLGESIKQFSEEKCK